MKSQRLPLAEMLVVIRAARAEEMRRSRVFVKSSRDAPMASSFDGRNSF